MKTKLYAALIAILAFYGVVLSQEYTIHISNNSNLRAIASLDGRIVETARAGSTLHVIGNNGQWLKISRNGSEVWMADWVSYTRVEGNGQQLASNVDNCCFVDRQCRTDKEWTDGYWAYQNNQCPVSTGEHQEIVTGSQAPNRSGGLAWTPNMTEAVKRLLANPSTDPFDNCCYMHWNTCHSDEDWKHGYWQYQNHQCVHPAPIGTFPAIEGNALFRKLVNDALELMRIHTPEWLNYIKLSGVRQFELLPPDRSGGFLNQQWSVVHSFYSWQLDDPNWAPDPDYVVGYAGGITHEACHAIQQRTYTQTIDWANELPCVEAQYDVIKTIKPNSKDVPWLRSLVGQ